MILKSILLGRLKCASQGFCALIHHRAHQGVAALERWTLHIRLSFHKIQASTSLLFKMLEQRIEQQFIDSADLKYQAAQVLSKPIASAIQAILACVTSGGKVLICGNGGSAADAQHFAAEFVGRFERERPELGAIALTTDSSILTAIGNDYDFDQIFSKQVRALGQSGDVLLAISTSGNSGNVLKAIEAAHQREMTVVALTGKSGGKMGASLRETDVHICVPHDRTARIQEVHLLVLHCLCDGVDTQLLGDQEGNQS
jgi:D-sedoheptulose 7-phosphate isomerase